MFTSYRFSDLLKRKEEWFEGENHICRQGVTCIRNMMLVHNENRINDLPDDTSKASQSLLHISSSLALAGRSEREEASNNEILDLSSSIYTLFKNGEYKGRTVLHSSLLGSSGYFQYTNARNFSQLSAKVPPPCHKCGKIKDVFNYSDLERHFKKVHPEFFYPQRRPGKSKQSKKDQTTEVPSEKRGYSMFRVFMY